MSEQAGDRAEAMPLLELVILATALGFCLWTLDSGGVLGLMGCLCGGVVGLNTRSILSSAFAGLWIGLILGGLVGGGIARMLDFAS